MIHDAKIRMGCFKSWYRQEKLSFLGEIFVHLEQFRHDLAFCHFRVEAISFHHGAVVGLMGFPEVGGHEGLVIQVGQGAVGILSPCIKDGLCGLLD